MNRFGVLSFLCLVGFVIVDARALLGNPTTEENVDQKEGDSETEHPFTLDDLKKMVPQTEEGNFLLTIDQIALTADDDEVKAILRKVRIELTSEVIEVEIDGEKKWAAVGGHSSTSCWVDRSKQFTVPLLTERKQLPIFKSKQWYKLIGRPVFEVDKKGKWTSRLKLVSAKQVEKPKE